MNNTRRRKVRIGGWKWKKIQKVLLSEIWVVNFKKMEEVGEQFLHKKESRLHMSLPVKHEMERKKRAGERVSQKPADKIADWLKVIERTHMGHRDDPRVTERIKGYYHKKYVLKSEEIPESYFENQRRLARELGHGDIEITNESRSQQSEVIISDQESTLDNWIDYFSSPDSDNYPMWAKYLAFKGMLKLGAYDKESHAFAKRDKETVAPYPDLNREALAYVVDAIIERAKKKQITMVEDNPELRQLLEGANFGKLYVYAIEKVTPTEENELLNTEGKWVRFPKGFDPLAFIPENFDRALVPSLQGHGTGWCTAGEWTAQAQLKGGDFYVYYSCDRSGQATIPRIAIRMQDTEIAEVRGIAHKQNLDPYIGDVLEKKLGEFGQGGEIYKKRVVDMKRLTEIDRKNTSGKELTTEELRFLYQFDSKIEGFGYQKDPRIQEILANRDPKSDLSLITGYSKEQISTTKEEALAGGIKLHYGFLHFGSLRLTKRMKLPEIIIGSVNLGRLQSAEGLTLPAERISGFLDLHNLQSARGLILPKIVGGFLNLHSLRLPRRRTRPERIIENLYLIKSQTAGELTLPEVGGVVNLRSLLPAEKERLRRVYPNLQIL